MTEKNKQWDVFISHANEDKKTFVKPLADALTTFGAKVWYDDFTLTVGDSLSRSIDKGLADSRFGIVVLSPDFFEKKWPEYELRGLTAREITGIKVILPIWHNVKKEDVLSYSPTLADKKAISSQDGPPVKIALKLLEIIRPDLFTRVLKRIAYFESLRRAKPGKEDPKKLAISPIRHKELPKDLVGRIRLIRAALWGAYSHSMEFWLDGFKRDAHPSREIAWWEHVAACYTEVAKLTQLSQEQHKYAYYVIFGLCSGLSEDELSKHITAIPKDALEKIRNVVKYRLPVYDIEDPFPKETEEIPNEVLEELSKYDIEHFPMK